MSGLICSASCPPDQQVLWKQLVCVDSSSSLCMQDEGEDNSQTDPVSEMAHLLEVFTATCPVCGCHTLFYTQQSARRPGTG